jgi:hypothetical protein
MTQTYILTMISIHCLTAIKLIFLFFRLLLVCGDDVCEDSESFVDCPQDCSNELPGCDRFNDEGRFDYYFFG